jgi:hemoglobin
MNRDIETRDDIELLIRQFYEKVKRDSVIGYIFTDLARVNWDKHLPVMFDFWENTLFFTGTYTGNPMKSHQRLHQLYRLNEKHFLQWVQLFTSTVDELFAGEKAELAKQRAISISTVMRIKIIQNYNLS